MTLQDYLREVKDRLAKATPGPWKRERWNDDEHIIPVTDTTGWMKDYPAAYIAKTGGWGFGYPIENGQLIASAPTDLATLAEICETLMEAVDKICSKGSLLYKGNIVESNTQSLQDIARQAKVRVAEIIAKTNPTNQTGE